MLANHPNVLGGGGVATNIIGGTGLFADGTVAAPSISFLADQDTGIYRIGDNNIGVAANGAKVLDISTGILAIASTGSDSYLNTISPSGDTTSFGCDATGQYTYAPAAKGIRFRTNGGTTALTLSSAQAATFAGAVVAPSLTAPASTALALAAGSGNQSITLTPSGTGQVFIGNGDAAKPSLSVAANSGTGINFTVSSHTIGIMQAAVEMARFEGANGRFLLRTTVDSGALLQLSTNALATTSAYGMVFGTDTFLYRSAAGKATLYSSAGETSLSLKALGNVIGIFSTVSAALAIDAPFAGGSIALKTLGTTALTLDSSQNATFAGAIKLANAYVATPVVSTGYVTIQDSTGTTYKIAVSL